MKILIVSQYYPPEVNAPANRVAGLARVWSDEGHQVSVLTGFPNHPEGRVYPGYRAHLPKTEFDHGVRIQRSPVFTAANEGIVLRSLAYASFSASVTLLAPFLCARPDVVIATSPPLLVGVAGAALALYWRRPLVLEVRDLWPDSISAVGVVPGGHPAIRGLHVLERALYRRAKRVTVVSRAFEPVLKERGVTASNIIYAPNGVDTDLFHVNGAKDEGQERWQDKFLVCFAGTVGMAHGIGTVLETARKLREHKDILFLIVGEGAERKSLETKAQRDGLDNVEFLGRLPRHRIPPLLRRADAALVMLRADPVFETVLPSKLFEAMGCGTPVLLGVDGEARRLIESAQAGVFFEPGDADALARSVLKLRESPDKRRRLGARGSRYVMEHFNRRTLALDYLRDISNMIDNTCSTSPNQAA